MIGWFGALVLVTVGVRLFDPTGWLGSDDASYHRAAEHILTGTTLQRMHHHNGRMAMIVPVAASITMFGDSPGAVVLPTFIASALCVILVAILGRLLWGWWEGLLAASVVSVLPFFRVLSTAAYPDVHACFWATLAVVLALLATRTDRVRTAVILSVGCGLAIGLAVSAKVLSVIVVVAVVGFLYEGRGRREEGRGERQEARGNPELAASLRSRFGLYASVIAGLVGYVLIDGLFFTWAADDFWFKLHTLRASQVLDGMFPPERYDLAGYASMVWERLTLLQRSSTSGWGRFGLVFWPTVLLVALLNRRGRPLALWGVAVYLVIAVVPIRFSNGPQPFPFFDGRYLLVACVPFALCLGWLLRRAACPFLGPTWIDRSWPAVLGVVVALSFMGKRELNGWRDRQTSRIAVAMQQIIAETDWDDDREIFMPASLYLRYRIFFPPHLRERLRVAVDGGSPAWWRIASVDVAARCSPLPPPGGAYLIATPTQFEGRPELFDYGVRLPREPLTAWHAHPPTLTIARFTDKTIGPAGSGGQITETVLHLIAPEAAQQTETRPDRDTTARERPIADCGLRIADLGLSIRTATVRERPNRPETRP